MTPYRILTRSVPRTSLVKIASCGVAIVALCQVAFGAEPPRGGDLIRQIPPAPAREKSAPKVWVEPEAPPALPDTDHLKFAVTTLRVSGQTLYREKTLLAVTGFRPGGELTLSELRGMAARIADYYHRHGFFLAQAYLPQQVIRDGVVTIAVIEGRYGKVALHNAANLYENPDNTLLRGLNPGDVIASAPLERRMLMLSDLPGLTVSSTLVPGEDFGTSDLTVEVAPGRRFTGEVDADNSGNRYTGVLRLGGAVNINESLGYGDVTTLRALVSDAGLYYVRGSYQVQPADAKIGVAYSLLGYKLGREFSSLQANGTAQIATLYGSYPVIRSRNNNLYAGLAFDYRMYQDRVDSTATVTDKNAQVLVASLSGESRDTLGGGGQNGYSLLVTAGNLDIQTAAVRSIDATTAKSYGPYGKLGITASRLQSVTENVSLYASASGQLAFKNLDVSEKMELGGMYAVRAYPEGEAYADEGYVLTAEARYQLPRFVERLPGQMQLVGFVDTGAVIVNRDRWTTEPNNRALSGAGGGVTWTDHDKFSLKAYYAGKLGSQAATSAPDTSGRFWIQFVKYF